MYRIDSADNVDYQFSDGDPGTGRLGTVVSADILNALMEELCHVVEGMGGTLSKPNNTQLLTAILSLRDKVNTWSALQKLAAALEVSGGNVALTQAALQAIRKVGGKLQVGTGDANDVELLRGDAVALALVAAGVDLKNQAAINVAQLGLQALVNDPSSPASGTVWFNSTLGKYRARVGSTTVGLLPDNKVADGLVTGSTGNLNRLLGGLAVTTERTAPGLYILHAPNLHNGVVIVTAIDAGWDSDRLIRACTNGTDQWAVRIAEQNGSHDDCDFTFHATVP